MHAHLAFGFWFLASLDSWLLVFGFCCFFWALVSLGLWLLAALLLNVCVVKGSLGGETSVLRTFRMSGKELVKERVSKEKELVRERVSQRKS